MLDNTGLFSVLTLYKKCFLKKQLEHHIAITILV